jgi:hypothetical protein
MKTAITENIREIVEIIIIKFPDGIELFLIS